MSKFRVGDNFLGKLVPAGYTVREYTICDVSPSGQYIKIREGDSQSTQWVGIADLDVVEYLDRPGENLPSVEKGLGT